MHVSRGTPFSISHTSFHSISSSLSSRGGGGGGGRGLDGSSLDKEGMARRTGCAADPIDEDGGEGCGTDRESGRTDRDMGGPPREGMPEGGGRVLYDLGGKGKEVYSDEMRGVGGRGRDGEELRPEGGCDVASPVPLVERDDGEGADPKGKGG